MADKNDETDAPEAAMANPSVYEERKKKDKYKKRPRSLYYYHAKVTPDGLRLTATNFFYNNGNDKIEEDEIPEIVRILALNARQTEGHVPPIHGVNFKDTWRKKSYIVILLDEENYEFRANKSSVEVDDGGANLPNYTFFDAEDLSIDVSAAGNGLETRSAVCFMNHMKKNHEGHDIYMVNGVPEKQKFYLKLHFGSNRRFSPYTAEGTNLGPPVAPPVLPL